jgi:hypothetical protein
MFSKTLYYRQRSGTTINTSSVVEPGVMKTKTIDEYVRLKK